MAKRKVRPSETGKGVDASGGPVFDPSANVLQLVDAESLRQDGLRQAGEESMRREIALRAEYDEKLRKTETARIDAIRAVDVDATRRTAEVAATQALALQAQVVTSAEAMRAQLASANATLTENLANGLKALSDAIATLQAQQWKDSGQRQQVVEARDVRGETRLNLGTIISLAVAVLAIAAYFAK